MESKKTFYKNQAESIIKNLEKRNMAGIYFENKEETAKYIDEIIKDAGRIAFGGTMTFCEMPAPDGSDKNLKEYIIGKENKEVLLKTPDMTYDEARTVFLKSFDSDIYFMSTNAITMDGELINIDGMGNRVASLIYGPKKVYVVCGMNKVCPDLDSAIKRARNTASPINCNRLNRKTPCSITGKCNNCLSEGTICSEFVYTRHSAIPKRIEVILVGDSLGY